MYRNLQSETSHHRNSHRRPVTKRPLRFIKGLFGLGLALMYMYVSSSLLIFHGPFGALRQYLIDSVAVTRHAYLLRPLSLFTLSNAEIAKHSQEWVQSKNVKSTQATRNFSAIDNSSIEIHHLDTSLFSADIMLIRNPNRVHVAVTKHVGTIGETVEQLVKDTNSIAGINGGSFNDAGWHGTGGIPMGTVITDGKTLQVDPGSPLIGITADGQLLCGYYDRQQLEQRHVQDALSFGPILVQNGVGVAPATKYGRNPRSAIGQKADGTIIFVVTDGRTLSHLGATYKDVQDIMLQYGAITAANLDGGSSTTLVYQGKVVNHPSDILGARYVATGFVVSK